MRTTRVFLLALLALSGCQTETSGPLDGASTDGAREAGSADTGAPRDSAAEGSTPDAARADAAAPDVAPPDAAPSDPYDSARAHCVDEINRYRAMLSLPPYTRWREGEACADQMADFDARTGVPHNGFNMGVCSPRGGGQNECPRYGAPSALDGCLAQMWAEGPTPDGSWDVAHGHYMNLVGDYTYMGFHQHFTRVACGYSAMGWMLQNFQ